MKVVIASHGMFPDQIGGMERHTYNLAAGLKKAGIDVTVLVPGPETLTEYPFPVQRLPWPARPLWLWSNRAFSKHVGRWIDQHKPDVAFGQGFALWTYLKRKKVLCIYHPHGLEMYGAHLTSKERLFLTPFRCLVEFSSKNSDVVVSLGGKLTNILVEQADVPNDSIRVIPNAVYGNQFQAHFEKKDWKKLLFVGRLAFNKGVDLLGEALRNTQNLDYELTIVGKGPWEDSVRKFERNDSRVTFLPGADEEELRNLYETSGGLIFTSRFEGMPTVILEAMASGCAVLATRIGAVETMVDAQTGVLMEPTVESIAGGIRSYFGFGEAVRRKMGEAARGRIEEKFDWEKVIEQYLTLFEELHKRHV